MPPFFFLSNTHMSLTLRFIISDTRRATSCEPTTASMPMELILPTPPINFASRVRASSAIGSHVGVDTSFPVNGDGVDSALRYGPDGYSVVASLVAFSRPLLIGTIRTSGSSSSCRLSLFSHIETRPPTTTKTSNRIFLEYFIRFRRFACRHEISSGDVIVRRDGRNIQPFVRLRRIYYGINDSDLQHTSFQDDISIPLVIANKPATCIDIKFLVSK